jgi:hypothetical protein
LNALARGASGLSGGQHFLEDVIVDKKPIADRRKDRLMMAVARAAIGGNGADIVFVNI